MSRTRRAVALLLLALAVALPAAALPAPRQEPLQALLETLRAHLAPVLALFQESRSTADPDGGTSTATEDPTASQTDDGDSRAGADPNG
ncbi:MAG TPA: hypothetical protein VF756_18495 [Thermoanaerobaculia bacterium]